MSGAELPDYSVAILIRDEINTLGDAVQGYLNQDHSPAEILICVNGSTDGSDHLGAELEVRYPGVVRTLESDAAQRKPGAWRKAFAEARCDYILFADGDVLPARQNGRLLVDLLARNQQAMVAAAAMWTLWPARPRSAFDWFGPFEPGEQPGPTFVRGAQYLLHRLRYAAAAERLGLPLMPEEVSEDGYVGAVTLTVPQGMVGDSRALAYMLPLGTRRECDRFMRRYAQAGWQFLDYPQFRRLAGPIERPRPWPASAASLRRAIRERKLLYVTKAIGKVWYAWFYYYKARRL